MLKIHDTAKTAARTTVFAVYIKHNSIFFCVVRTVLAPCQYRGLPQAERCRLVVPFPRIDTRQRWRCSLVAIYLPPHLILGSGASVMHHCFYSDVAHGIYTLHFPPLYASQQHKEKKQQIDSEKKCCCFRAYRRITISLQMRNLQPN